MKRIGIISDDLTGASDSGIQLSEKGIQTSVLFYNPKDKVELTEGLVINTGSRSSSLTKAKESTKEAAKFLKDNGYLNIFKKMDSTMRGYIGEELEEIREVLNPEFILVAPAYPELGRTTLNGIHYLNGNPVSETEISRDPTHPVSESHIPTIINKTTNNLVGTLNIKDIRGDFSEVKAKLEGFMEKEIVYIVSDAETQDDLRKVVDYIKKVSDDILWAGSAGLAEVLPEALGISSREKSKEEVKVSQVLTVCGSLSEVSKKQVNYMIAHSDTVGLNVDTLKMFDEGWGTYMASVVTSSKEILEANSNLVIYLPSDEDVRKAVQKKASQGNITESRISEIINTKLAEVTKKVLEASSDIEGLILTGGDTAIDIVLTLNGSGLNLLKQIEAGIPLGKLIGGDNEYYIVTKAGAFGNEKSLQYALKELKGEISNG